MDVCQHLRQWAINHLAGVIYRCVEWKEDYPRADSDWANAERIIDSHGDIFEMANLLSQSVGLHVMSQLLQHSWGRQQFEPETFLSERKLDETLGRRVFGMYQSYRHELPRPPYGKFLFD